MIWEDLEVDRLDELHEAWIGELRSGSLRWFVDGRRKLLGGPRRDCDRILPKTHTQIYSPSTSLIGGDTRSLKTTQHTQSHSICEIIPS